MDGAHGPGFISHKKINDRLKRPPAIQYLTLSETHTHTHTHTERERERERESHADLVHMIQGNVVRMTGTRVSVKHKLARKGGAQSELHSTHKCVCVCVCVCVSKLHVGSPVLCVCVCVCVCVSKLHVGCPVLNVCNARNVCGRGRAGCGA